MDSVGIFITKWNYRMEVNHMATFIVGTIVIGSMILVSIKLFKKSKNGCSSCGGGCSGCAGSCHKIEIKK